MDVLQILSRMTGCFFGRRKKKFNFGAVLMYLLNLNEVNSNSRDSREKSIIENQVFGGRLNLKNLLRFVA